MHLRWESAANSSNLTVCCVHKSQVCLCDDTAHGRAGTLQQGSGGDSPTRPVSLDISTTLPSLCQACKLHAGVGLQKGILKGDTRKWSWVCGRPQALGLLTRGIRTPFPCPQVVMSFTKYLICCAKSTECVRSPRHQSIALSNSCFG